MPTAIYTEQPDTEQEMFGKVLEAARKLISDAVKRNVIENIVPIAAGPFQVPEQVDGQLQVQGVRGAERGPAAGRRGGVRHAATISILRMLSL